MLEAFVGVELVGHALPLQRLGQHHALVKRHQLVVDAVQDAQRRQALQVVQGAVLIVRDTIDNNRRLCLFVWCCPARAVPTTRPR